MATTTHRIWIFRPTDEVEFQGDVIFDGQLLDGDGNPIPMTGATGATGPAGPAGPAGGAGNIVQTQVDFGFPSGNEGDVAVATVLASWVTSTMLLICCPAAAATADHGLEDAVAEGITAYAGNIVNGVSFDVYARAPAGSWGRYLINCTGGEP